MDMKRVNAVVLEQFVEDIKEAFPNMADHFYGNNPNAEIDVEKKTIRFFHNCGCHESLLDNRFHIEPTEKFQKILDRYDAWFENENPETGKVYFN